MAHLRETNAWHWQLLDGGHDSLRPSRGPDGERLHEHPLWEGVSTPYRSVRRRRRPRPSPLCLVRAPPPSRRVGPHPLPAALPPPPAPRPGQIIRAFLVHFHNQVLLTHNGVRQSEAHPPFDFTGGSVGNFFFAGELCVLGFGVVITQQEQTMSACLVPSDGALAALEHATNTINLALN